MEISGYGNKCAELWDSNRDLLKANNLTVAKAGKSAAIRTFVPVIDFHKPFEDYIDEMHIICKAIDKLKRIVTEFDYDA